MAKSTSPMHAKRQGFTLIEMSIILTIIALIVGGVLVGRELVHLAQLRKVISNIESYKTAVNTFRLKYNCIPGDCNRATQFWTSDTNCASGGDRDDTTPATVTCNGDGDTRIYSGNAIDYGGGNPVSFFEVHMFWQHLGLAGLIPGTYTGKGAPAGGWISITAPLNAPYAFGNRGAAGIIYAKSLLGTFEAATENKHIFQLGLPAPSMPYVVLFSANDGLVIDSKMDDGRPFSGQVTGYYNQFFDACGINATNYYTGSDTVQVGSADNGWVTIGCSLNFNAEF